MRKCRAEFNYGGHWIGLVSRWRPFLSAGLHKLYSDADNNKALRQMLRGREINILVDVGGAIGYYAIMFTFAYPAAKIYTLEPAAVNWDDMRENVGAFSNIIPIKMAAMNRNGCVDIALPLPRTKAYRRSAENPGQISIHGDSMLFKETVPCKKLDDMFAHVDYLKIDAEGADFLVLQGAERLLREARPLIQVEMLPENFKMGNYSGEGLFRYLNNFDYKPVYSWGIDCILFPKEMLSAEELKAPIVRLMQ